MTQQFHSQAYTQTKPWFRKTHAPQCSLQDCLRQPGHGCQGCISPRCLFNLYGEYITRNARLHEAQAGIKPAGRNIYNLRYEDDTTLVAESEEELKSLLMKVKEDSENTGLKLNIQKS